MQLHFYDALTAGKSSVEGQVVRFDSALFADGREPVVTSTAVKLRDDLFIDPATLVNSDLYDLPLSSGLDEYQWSRQINGLFALNDCLHIGLGSSVGYDLYIRNTLYRNLSDLPNTQLPRQSCSIDIATVARAVHLLRPETLPWDFGGSVGNDMQIRHRLTWDCISVGENRALRIKNLLGELMAKSGRLVQFAMANASPDRIKDALGLEQGAVSDLAAINPCFITHQTVPNARRAGVFMPVAVDIAYPDIIYFADLECDLSDLCDPDYPALEKLVRHSTDHPHLPLVRLNLSRMPFVAPLGVVRPQDAKRLGIDLTRVTSNVDLLRTATAVALRLLDEPIMGNAATPADVDYRMLSGEYRESDIALIRSIHSIGFEGWLPALAQAHDNRIMELGRRVLLRYHAHLLSDAEQQAWSTRVKTKMLGGRFTPDRVAEVLKQADDNARAYPTARGVADLAGRLRRVLGERQT